MNLIPVLSSRQAIAQPDGLPTSEFFKYMQAVVRAFGVGKALSVTPTTSPYVYTASGSGSLIVAGGTVQKLEIGVDSTYYDIGVLAGLVPLAVNSKLRITYTVVPTLTFIPGAA